jgi:3-dehydroquinate synthase II
MSFPRIVLEITSGGASEDLRAFARKRGFHRFLLSEETPGVPPEGESVYRKGTSGEISDQGKPLGQEATVREPKELEGIAERLHGGHFVLLSFVGESVIPLENLIAYRQGKGTLWVRAPNARSAPGLLGALESGSDAVVVPVKNGEEVTQLEGLLELIPRALTWKEAEVLRVAPGGMGDRVILDTTSTLTEKEGMLVGSAGAFLLHVVSEAAGSRYTRPRPFRVNAGAIHSYTLLANGETRYLSEVEPGDQVVVTVPGGSSRAVRVGRIKIERRPLSLIEVAVEGGRFTLFAQEAETVRLSGVDGPLAVTGLSPGSKVWGVTLPKARHFGRAVEETIQER